MSTLYYLDFSTVIFDRSTLRVKELSEFYLAFMNISPLKSNFMLILSFSRSLATGDLYSTTDESLISPAASFTRSTVNAGPTNPLNFGAVFTRFSTSILNFLLLKAPPAVFASTSKLTFASYDKSSFKMFEDSVATEVAAPVRV